MAAQLLTELKVLNAWGVRAGIDRGGASQGPRLLGRGWGVALAGNAVKRRMVAGTLPTSAVVASCAT